MLKVVIEIGKDKKTSRTYGFTEAIEHVEENFRIRDQDLVEAYTLDGNIKQLEQKFVRLLNNIIVCVCKIKICLLPID